MEREITRKEFNKIQKRFIKNNPVCSRCGGPACEVHHILPIVYGGTNEESNLASLCSCCHKELDIWEVAWVRHFGDSDFEGFFSVFCCMPSTHFLASFICGMIKAEKDLPEDEIDETSINCRVANALQMLGMFEEQYALKMFERTDAE